MERKRIEMVMLHNSSIPGDKGKLKKRVVTEIKISFWARKKQVRYWLKALRHLKLDPKTDFDMYIRQAFDQSIGLDFRSSNEVWQKYIKACQPLAKKILGHALVENASERLRVMKEIEGSRNGISHEYYSPKKKAKKRS